MGKYDAIRGAGNVTVNAPPDFWTSAKQSFDDDYDRLTLAQQRKKEEERYNSETAKEESRYNETTSTERSRYLEQQKQIEDETNRKDWQYMYEGVKTDAQRAIIYKNGLNNEVSGLTAAGLTAIEKAGSTETSLNKSTSDFYAGDDLYRHENGAEIVANLIKNNKPTQAAHIERSMKESRKNVENKEVINMISAQYGDVFSPQLETFFSTTGDVSDAQLNMGVEMMKQSKSLEQKSMTEKFGLAESLIGMQTKGEFPSQGQINTVAKANAMGYLLMQELTAKGGVPPVTTKQLPFPTLGSIDETTTGLKNTFDDMDEKRKSVEFERVLKESVPGGKEAWGNMDDSERSAKGIEIINIINKKEYEAATKAAGFGGIEYEDPEYVGKEIEFPEEDISKKMESIFSKKRVPESQRKKKNVINQIRTEALEELQREREKESRKRASKISKESFPAILKGASRRDI